MTELDLALEAGRRALIVALELSLPILAAGMAVALLVSIAQAMTQVQEQTLSLVPKIAAMGGAVILLLPWLLEVASEYARDVLGNLIRGVM